MTNRQIRVWLQGVCEPESRRPEMTGAPLRVKFRGENWTAATDGRRIVAVSKSLKVANANEKCAGIFCGEIERAMTAKCHPVLFSEIRTFVDAPYAANDAGQQPAIIAGLEIDCALLASSLPPKWRDGVEIGSHNECLITRAPGLVVMLMAMYGTQSALRVFRLPRR